MYPLTLKILRTLHDDHVKTLALLERLERLLARHPEDRPADAADPEVASTLAEAIEVMESEITHHYAFEEEHLFPRFTELADAGIPMMLKDEHETIRPLAERLAALARTARAAGFTADTWMTFHHLAGEIVEREVFHVQKEEMGFLPALDQMLDPADDGPLQMAYAAAKAG